VDTPYLLTGIAVCAACGGSLAALTRDFKRQGRMRLYGCAYYHKRGRMVCKNKLLIRQDLLDHAVIEAIREALDERLLQAAVTRAVERLQGNQDQRGGRLAAIRQEI